MRLLFFWTEYDLNANYHKKKIETRDIERVYKSQHICFLIKN